MASYEMRIVPPFSGGINTEINDLLDLPTYTSDELNCRMFSDGIRARRLGIDFEKDYKYGDFVITTGLDDTAFSSFCWSNPGKVNPPVYLLQCGRYIYLYSSEGKPISDKLTDSIIDLNDYKIDNEYYKYPVTFTEAYGYLYITGEHIDCIKYSYEPITVGEDLPAKKATASIPFQVPWSKANYRFYVDTVVISVKPLGAAISYVVDESNFSGRFWDSGTDVVNQVVSVFNSVASSKRFGFTAKKTTVSGKDQWHNSFIEFTAPNSDDNTKYNGYEFAYTYLFRDGSYYKVVQGASTSSGGRNAQSSSSYQEKKYSLRIRDIEGVYEEAIEVDTTPATLTPEHQYNLQNQGWYINDINSYYSKNNRYPSHAMQWFAAKTNLTDSFVPENLLKIGFGTTQAPRGKYILDFFNPDRKTVSGVSKLPADKKLNYRVTDCVFWSGRLFYLVGSTLLYTQILLEDSRNSEKCYQDADPSSETLSDLVASDGGHIFMPQIGRGIRLAVIGQFLVVFGDDAIWAIAGTQNGFFSATGFTQYQLASFGTSSKYSIVNTENGLYYWSDTGIYNISPTEDTGYLNITNITYSTIQTYYDGIEDFSKQRVKSVYDSLNKIVMWYYPSNKDDLHNYDCALVLDMRRKSFMPWKIGNGSNIFEAPAVVDFFVTKKPFSITPSIIVCAGGETVKADNQDVVIDSIKDKDFYQNIIYIAFDKTQNKITFADYWSKGYKDWDLALNSDGSTFKSFLLSRPYNFAGEGETPQYYQNKQTPYVLTTFSRTEEQKLANGEYLFPSGCFFSNRWDFSISPKSFKWDSKQQLYRTEPDFMEFEYVQTKTRSRGTGKAVQIYLESDGTKDFRLQNLTFYTRRIQKW